MSLYKIQGKAEKRKGIYYEFDSSDTPLGEGGMGKVYKGRCIEESTNRSYNVAVKFMYSDLPPYAIEKARREAAIHFKHENLIEMLGFVETETKSVLGEVVHCYHVVSELLEGVSLDHFFEGKLTDQRGNFVPYAEKLFKDYQQDAFHFAGELIKSILSGLMIMHDAGYIHRDISPDNIMITSDGHIKLIDFGIAKKMNSLTSHDKHLTQAGQFIGKPEYAAPELVLGAINEQNQTTDIYAVGILLFQCVVGHLPFEGDRADVLLKQRHSSLPLKLVKHRDLRKVIAKATEKSRAKRFQSAAEFRVAIDNALSHNPNPLVNWKVISFSISGVAACIIGVLWCRPIKKEPTEDSVAPITYASTIAKLHSCSTATEGVKELEYLSESGMSDATFLLSRLLFKSKKEGDYCPDSIKIMQDACQLQHDNVKAHELLKKTLSQAPMEYHAIYELACDYLGGSGQRTDAVERNVMRADTLFNEARKYAEKANDEHYIRLIEMQMNKYKNI